MLVAALTDRMVALTCLGFTLTPRLKGLGVSEGTPDRSWNFVAGQAMSTCQSCHLTGSRPCEAWHLDSLDCDDETHDQRGAHF